MEARPGPLARGLLSYVSTTLGSRYRFPPASSIDATYCYSIFLRHLSYVTPLNGGETPLRVAELGPGISLGMGLAALLAGAETYLALDTIDHTDPARDLEVFDRLVEMFRARLPVPVDGVCADAFPPPLSPEFPPFLAQRLDALLAPERVAAIRADVGSRAGRFIRLIAPWDRSVPIPPRGVDWIMSHSVLMYVEDLDAVHACFAAWLRPGGVMTHEIDYTSNAITRHWNGHWALSEGLWRLIRGRRPYLINREPHATYIAAAERHGFEVLREIELPGQDGIPRAQFAPRFRGLSERDATLAEALVVSRARVPEAG
ncbi:MAG: hypothetical protein JSR21_09320 [Proteobacteria bacterium]|nr:hypothetical protein [Pseudomonadota bacterium]